MTPEVSALSLMARILATEIDPDLVELLQNRTVAECLERCEPDCASALARPWTQEEIEAAAVEYCRLFVVPQAVAPLASAWLSDENAGGGAAIAGLVDQIVAIVELELPQELAVLPRDHIAVLLAIAAWMIETSHPAADDFIARTLSPWLGRFSSELAAQAELPLYRAFGSFLGAADAGVRNLGDLTPPARGSKP